jgi:hypothetical protein
MFPQKLQEVVSFLNEIGISISENNEDGRVNSIDDEKTIINVLEEKYGKEDIIRPQPRDWWDVKVFGFPIQLKSSDFKKKASDNFSSKAAILYALTYLPEDKVKVLRWEDFEKALLNFSDVDNGRDYYIIVIDKGTKKVYLNSLKSLSKLTANGNNLPFQIKWVDNLIPIQRTHRQAYEFIVECYKKSVAAKINAHPIYQQL